MQKSTTTRIVLRLKNTQTQLEMNFKMTLEHKFVLYFEKVNKNIF